MRTTHRRLAAALALPFLLVALAACSKDSTTSTSSTTAGTTPATSAATAPATTATKGTTKETAMAEGVQITVITTPFGKALGNGEGLVLYAWEQDTPGSSKCTSAACVEKWPPLLAASLDEVKVGDGVVDAMHFTLIDRPDGTTQVALDGRPLHTMSADAPGEANCQGLDGWWIQTPEGGWNKNTTAS